MVRRHPKSTLPHCFFCNLRISGDSMGDVNLDVVNMDLETPMESVIPSAIVPPLKVSNIAFCPGGIHSQEVFSVWKDGIQSSEWVLDVLQNGYSIPFKDEPGPYEESNNASVIRNMKTVRQLVGDMIATGIVKVTSVKPVCVSPLGLVSKIKEDGSVKHRLIFDASRHLNLLIPDTPVKLAHLDKALDITNHGDFQTVFDLSSAYYHIRIRNDQTRFLGASISNSDGSPVYFVFLHLPMGLKCAVHAITKIWKPITAFLNNNGIRSSIYIDDGRLLASDAYQAELNRVFVYNLLEKLGWTVEMSKSDQAGGSSQCKEYLGFIINTVAMEVKVKPTKLDSVCDVALQLLEKKEEYVKDLSSVLGKVIALIPSHGFLARVSTRSGYVAIEEHIANKGWTGKLSLSGNCKKEIKFFCDYARMHNGAPIQTSLTQMRLDNIILNPIAKTVQVPTFGSSHDLIMVSDSSDFKAAVYNLHDGHSSAITFAFDVDEKTLSSGMRELLAVKKTLQVWRHDGSIRNALIYWITDSSNVVAFLQKGSSKSHVQATVFDIAILQQELHVKIIPVHLLRSDPRIQLADDLSKIRDSDDWSLDEFHVSALILQFQLHTDVFASYNNHRCARFYTSHFEENCAGVNGFAQQWGSGLWMCPPIRLLPAIASEIRKRKCEGILVLPDWPSSNFFGLFFGNNKIALYPFRIVHTFYPFIYQNQEASSALKGKVDFAFFALYFNTL